jgi:hypothetical protein
LIEFAAARRPAPRQAVLDGSGADGSGAEPGGVPDAGDPDGSDGVGSDGLEGGGLDGSDGGRVGVGVGAGPVGVGVGVGSGEGTGRQVTRTSVPPGENVSPPSPRESAARDTRTGSLTD